MTTLETADFSLDMDEPTYGMAVFEDASGFCTRLRVIRSGCPLDVTIHHGTDAELSGKVPPMFVPSVEGEVPVGLMLELSEKHRNDLRWWEKAQQMRAESTLIQDILKQDEADHLASRNLSTFGPHQVTQRNGHNRRQVERDWWAERVHRSGQVKSYRIQGIRG